MQALSEIETDCIIEFTHIGSMLNSHKNYCKWIINEAKRFEKKNKNLQIKFNGWLNSENLAKFYERSDIFVCLSKTEAYPTSLLEAGHFGLLRLTTPVGDAAEICDLSYDKVLSKNFSDNELTTAIKAMINVLIHDENYKRKYSKKNNENIKLLQNFIDANY